MPIPDQQTPQASPAPIPSTSDNSTPPPQPTTAPTSDAGSVSAPPQAQPSQPQQTPQAQTSVSNAPAANDVSQHPSVQRASILHTIAQTLAGGPRYVATPNSDGTVTRTRVPLSRGDILSAIALEALSGGLAGLGQRGPGATGRAAEAGFQQVSQQQQQAQQQQEQQAQQDAKSKSDALVRQAQSYEQNSRVILNTMQAERYGVDSLKDAVQQNAQLLSDYDDAGAVQERNVPQDTLSAGLASKKYDALKQIAIPDGFTTINGKYEQTFSIVSDPRAKVPLTQEQAQALGNAGIQGFTAFADGKSKIPDGTLVPGTMVARANQQLQANNLMKLEYSGVVDALQNSSDKGNQALAKSIPSVQSLLTDPNNGPVFQNALSKFQRYVSHSDMHGMDFYESLQQMAAPSKPNPQNPKQFIPNPDAQQASTIAGAFGNGDPRKGWAILQAYHNEVTPTSIKDESEATNILADPDSSAKQIAQAKKYLAISQQQKAATAGAEAQAKKAAEGAGTGTGNAAQFANEQPVNGVRQNYLSNLPPTQSELVRSIGEGRSEISSRTASTKEGKALMEQVTTAYPGYDFSRAPEYAATRKAFTSGKTADAINALNTAMGHMLVMSQNATLGGSLPILGGVERAAGNQSAIDLANAKTALVDELGKAYKAGALTDQDVKSWKGRIDAWSPSEIQGNAKSFVQLLDSKLSSYEQQWKNGSPPGAVAPIQILSPEARNAYQTITGRQPITGSQQTQQPQSSTSQRVVPAGATPGRDAQGNIIGYRTADGQVVRF
jgi:hypothetical protein